MNEVLIIVATIVIIALVVFVAKMTMRMANQLTPNAKPVKTVLIEGEILDIPIETELSPNTT